MRQTLGVLALLIEAVIIFAAFRYDQASAHTWLIGLSGWGVGMATVWAFFGLMPNSKGEFMSGIESLVVEPGDFCHEPNWDSSGAPNDSVFTSVCSITSMSFSSSVSSVTAFGFQAAAIPHD